MGEKIVLKPAGAITAGNTGILEKSFLEQMGGIASPDIIVDMAEVSHISSAGLRLIMKLQQTTSSMQLVNLNPEVYEVFSITGLTRIMDVRRQYKNIDLEGLELIGQGATASVYRIDEEQIVKVYREDIREEEILHEQELTRNAMLAGVPTMLSFEMVKAGGRLGTVFEAFNYDTLISVYTGASMEEREELIRKYARTLREMCSVEVDPGEFTGFRSITWERYERAKERLSEEGAAVFRDMIERIPDDHRFVHGDCHMENLMLDGKGSMVVIDLGISGYGNAIFALSGVAHYKVFTELISDEASYKKKSGLSFGEAEELYHRFIEAYCEGQKEEQIRLADQGVYLYSCLFSALEYVGTPLVTDETFRDLAGKLIKASEEGFDWDSVFRCI